MKKFFIVTLMAGAAFACSRKNIASKDAAAQAALIEQGHTVHDAKCGKCHVLKDRAAFTTTQWEGIMQVMAPKAKLTEAETKQVTAYVKAGAKK
jgi:hypothetical protein